jgi:photosystem II stability/assembly factor-like uncharacterized protein
MKTLIKFFAFLLIAFFVTNIFAQPVIHNNAARFYDIYTGVVVSNYGVISKTTDGGLTWSSTHAATMYSLNDIVILDQMTYIACGDFGTIMKTTDGGISWYPVLSPVTDRLSALSATESSLFSVGANGTIISSSDMGESWNIVAQYPGENFHSIQFTDINTGFIAGDGSAIYKTVNGGMRWNKLNLNIPSYNLNSLHMFDQNSGMAVGDNGVVILTKDGGYSWSVIKSRLAGNLFSIDASDNNEILVCGDNSALYKSTDGGYTWNGVTLPQGNSYSFKNIQFTGTLNGYSLAFVVGENGVKLYSGDGGSIWYNTPSWFQNNTTGINKKQFDVTQNFPNPFNPSTTISYVLPYDANVNVKVFDVIGREVALLVNGFEKSGSHQVNFNASKLSSGVYFYNVTATHNLEKFEKTMKMILTK